jgi:hypothetical protein
MRKVYEHAKFKVPVTILHQTIRTDRSNTLCIMASKKKIEFIFPFSVTDLDWRDRIKISCVGTFNSQVESRSLLGRGMYILGRHLERKHDFQL